MKAITHLMAKDLRRFWPFAVSLALLIVLSVFRVFWGIKIGEAINDVEDTMWLFGKWVLIFFFVIFVFHEDNADDDRSFWVTRPIWPGQLICAKSLVCILTLAIPYAVANCVLASLIGSSSRAIFYIGVESVGVMLLMIAATAFIAVNTKSILQTIGVTVAGTVALFFAGVVTNGKFDKLDIWPHAWRVLDVNQGTKLLVMSSVLVAGLMYIVYRHYRCRSTRVALYSLGALLLVSTAAYHSWPLGIIPNPERVKGIRPPAITNFILHAESTARIDGQIYHYNQTRKKYENHNRVALPLTLSSGNPSCYVEIGNIESALVREDGTLQTFHPIGTQSSDIAAIHKALRSTLGFPVSEQGKTPASITLLGLQKGDPLVEGATKLHLRSKLGLTEYAFTKSTTLPLETGAHFTDKNDYWKIDRIENGNGTSNLTFSIQRSLSLLHPWWTERNLMRKYILHNKRLDEFSLGEAERYWNVSISDNFAHRRISGITFSHRQSMKMEKPTQGLDANWLADAELWILDGNVTGFSEYILEEKNLTILPERPSRVYR